MSGPITARVRVRAVLVCTVVAGALVGGSASPAQATTLLACPGAESATFSPALTNTPQSVSIAVSDTYGPCVNAAAPLELRTGTATAAIPPASRSCTTLTFNGPGSRSISWSTGTTSTFSYTATTAFLAGGAIQVVQTGTITTGEFAGATAIGVVTVANPGLLACGGSGVSSFSGVAVLTLTS